MPTNGGFKRLFACRRQLRALTSIKVGLHLSTNLFKFFWAMDITTGGELSLLTLA